MVRPSFGGNRLWNAASNRKAVTYGEIRCLYPSLSAEEAVIPRRANRPPACDLDSKDGPTPDLPDSVRPRAGQSLSIVYRPDFGLGAHEVADRHPPAVRQTHQRVAWDAFSKVRHHGPLVLPLLDAAIELR